MLGKGSTPRSVVSIVLAFGVVFAMPLAGAFGMGIDAASVSDMKSVGATPQYAQIWVGSWVLDSGWGSIDSNLREARDNGAIPVIQYYYWGDSISVNGVKYGQEGRSKSEWFSLAKTTASHAKNILGDKPFLMVLEPEFNKNGIQHWEEFDGLLAAMADDVKDVAPRAKIVTGLGYWNDGAIFDRIVSESSYVGFMLLRASTRDSSSEAIGAADQVISTAKSLKAKWGKDVIVFDLGIGSYGGWEGVQERSLQKFIEKRAELDAAGVEVIVWRYLKDNSYSSGYFGAAESSWGVIRKDGSKKPAYGELVTLIKGASSTTSTSSGSTTTTTTTTTSGVFSGVKGNEWWIEAKVANTPKSVQARVNDGAWVSLSYKSWGAWAVSTRAPTGSTVELRATYGDGSTKSASYLWPSATPVSGSSSGADSGSGTTTSTFDATFSGVKVLEYWVQTSVRADDPIAKVEARVNGGSWQTLTKQSWGGYAKSFKVASGAKVEFRATSTSGATDISGGYYR